MKKHHRNLMKTATFFFLSMVILLTAIPVKAEAAAKKKDNYKQGEVYTITPESAPLKESGYDKSYAYNKNTKNYFTIRSYMEKFERDGKGTLVLKKGTYTMTHTIFVPSNVTIIFEDGVKIEKMGNSGVASMPASITIFQLIKPSNVDRKGVYSKHDGEKNIHFVGKGNVTINLKNLKYGIAIVMGHNQNVTVDNITFMNMNTGHFIEMDASKNVAVTNCTFKNAKKGSDYVKEAINIDTPDKETGGFNNVWTSYDKTPNEDVLIENCKFTNLGRAVGTHKYSANGKKQVYHTNITLRGNIISNMKWDSPIRIMNWKDSTVENNKIKNVIQDGKTNSRGILVSGAYNVSIKNNTISKTDRPIQCIAWKNIGTASQYPITYNHFTKQNLTDFSTNIGSDLFSGEYFVRINEEYNVYTNAIQIPIEKK